MPMGLAFVRREKHMTEEETQRDDDAWERYWEIVDKEREGEMRNSWDGINRRFDIATANLCVACYNLAIVVLLNLMMLINKTVSISFKDWVKNNIYLAIIIFVAGMILVWAISYRHFSRR